jgi:hypothetical protein
MPSLIGRHHSEWLNLLAEVSGPFLSPPVLQEAMPQGLEDVHADLRGRIRAAHDEWEADGSLLHLWVGFVLGEVLGLPAEVRREGPALPPGLSLSVPEHEEMLRPDGAVIDPDGARPRLLVRVWPAAQALDGRVRGSRWAASPRDRMAELLRGTACRLGLCTNGRTWTLVAAAPGRATTYVSWDAGLWGEEPLTLRSFRTLLSANRFFAVAERDTLEGLLERSANAQEEVTFQLGTQVRAAVETLVDTLDRAHRDSGSVLLREVSHEMLYRAAVTVMMRLVFLFYAEENGLLPLGDPLYDASYAASTLRAQLQEDADLQGEDPLERRYAAWHRLLAAFRLVHGGVQHEQLRLPAHGGGLFDPEAYPFLEGRAEGDPWRRSPEAQPLPVDDRTTLHLLDSLQVLRTPGQEARRLSFRALDVEQIGHVYEGLLDHVAIEAEAPALGLEGRKEPELAVGLIEERAGQGHEALVAFLAEETGRTPAAVERALGRPLEPPARASLRAACQNDDALLERVAPYHALIRVDHRAQPRVFVEGSVYVTRGSERRSSGTYYTPRTLAEEVVRHALEPLAYAPGPAEGAESADWRLRPSDELLDLRVCDLSVGSGAFLVATCRWLAERLLEAWTMEGAVEVLGEPIPGDADDRLNFARRLVAERCLYGVDLNPMAVDMAKLSLWLVTMAKGRPFTFVDHALKRGDSLLGVTSAEQLAEFHLDPRRGREIARNPFGWHASCEPLLKRAVELRRRLESFTVREVRDAEAKAALQAEVHELLTALRVVADVLVGAALSTATGGDDAFDDRVLTVRRRAAVALDPHASADDRALALEELRRQAIYWLDEGRPKGARVPSRRPFHWPLEFPEVILDRGHSGFDAMIGNPPFLGNKYWKESLGRDFQGVARNLLGRTPGKIDLSVVFLRRALQFVARQRGVMGLLCAAQAAEGQAVDAGLQYLTEHGAIFRARSGMTWPGNASVRVNVIWLLTGDYGGRRVLDGLPVSHISSRLTSSSAMRISPNPLVQPDLWAFAGVDNSKGSAFLLNVDNGWFDILRDEGLVRPYVSGVDLTTYPPGTVTRWAVATEDLSLEEIVDNYPHTLRFLREVVAPTRDEATLAPYKGLHRRWWQFWNHRAGQFRRLRARERCIVLPKVATYAMSCVSPTRWTYTNKVILVEVDQPGLVGLLQSTIILEWLTEYSTSFGGAGDVQPSVTLGINTLVAPAVMGVELVNASLLWGELSAKWCQQGSAGQTTLFNRIHDEEASTPLINSLREVMVSLDAAVAKSYGWEHTRLNHGFWPTRRGVRFTISPSARVEVIERLLELNHQRYAAEVERGLHSPKRARAGQLTIEGI